jgi:hypothetical protein
VQKALEQGLDAVAITDHNTAENVVAVREAAERIARDSQQAPPQRQLVVFGGMEINTMEEIHILALFQNDEELFSMQELIYNNLPGENNPDYFGPQYIVDSKDYVEGINEHLLIGATTLSLERIIDAVHERSGLVIASHIDRESFSLISQLGFVPPDLELDAVEFSPYYRDSQVEPAKINFPSVFFSDSHQPEDIGRICTVFYVEQPTIEEIRKAFRADNGRGVI